MDQNSPQTTVLWTRAAACSNPHEILRIVPPAEPLDETVLNLPTEAPSLTIQLQTEDVKEGRALPRALVVLLGVENPS